MSRSTQAEKTTAIAGQLAEAQSRIQTLEEELQWAKELLAIQANLGQGNPTELEIGKPDIVLVEVRRKEPVADMVPEKERKWDREREILKDKLAAQATMKEKEKQLCKTVEDEKRRIEEGLRRLQSNMDQLKEEKNVGLERNHKERITNSNGGSRRQQEGMPGRSLVVDNLSTTATDY